MKKIGIKKADIILALILLIAGLGSLALVRHPGAEGLKAIVYYRGNPIDTLNLNTQTEFVRNYEFEEGFNTVKVEDGCIRVEDADCSGRECMQFGKADTAGQVIICAPHKLLIKITGGDGVDSTAY